MLHTTEFSSFFMGGFEACAALSEHGQRHNMLSTTQHDLQCCSDYRLLKERGIRTVRESLVWHQIDQGIEHYDFSFFEKIMRIAADEEMQVIWGLNHFDLPDGVDPFSPELIERFVAYALAAVKTIRRYTPDTIYVVPFNEMSFFTWIGAEIGVWGPHVHQRGGELKIHLTKCVIAAIKEIRKLDSDIKFIHIDPIMNRMAGVDSEMSVQHFAADFREAMYEAWDMVYGRLRPELGGSPELVDFIGLNYYIYNQEEVTMRLGTENSHPYMHIEPLLNLDHPLWTPFDQIIREVYDRYRVPIIVTETGCHGSLREGWWSRLLPEIDHAIQQGIPVQGVCAYPIIDRPDWHYGHLTNSGFWDFEADDSNCIRIPQEQVLCIIQDYLEDDQQALRLYELEAV